MTSRPAIPVGIRASVGLPSVFDWLIFVLMVQWQDHRETCSISQRTVEFDPAAHLRHEAPNHPQTDPESAAIGSGHNLFKRREDPRLILRRNTGAVIPDGDAHCVPFALKGDVDRLA